MVSSRILGGRERLFETGCSRQLSIKVGVVQAGEKRGQSVEMTWLYLQMPCSNAWSLLRELTGVRVLWQKLL